MPSTLTATSQTCSANEEAPTTSCRCPLHSISQTRRRSLQDVVAKGVLLTRGNRASEAVIDAVPVGHVVLKRHAARVVVLVEAFLGIAESDRLGNDVALDHAVPAQLEA